MTSSCASHNRALKQALPLQLAVEALQSQLSPASSRKARQLAARQHKQLEQHRRRSFAPTGEQLKGMNLQPGQNNVDFSFSGQRLRAYIYCCSWNSRWSLFACSHCIELPHCKIQEIQMANNTNKALPTQKNFFLHCCMLFSH